MLIITRNKGESLIIGHRLRITVLTIQGKQIQLGSEDLGGSSILSISTLKVDQTLRIGKGLTIMAVQVRGNQVKLGIDSPKDVQILRGEVYDKDTANR